MSFRTNLNSLRVSHNMTQEQLAMLVGVSRQSVTKWEAGKASPDMDKLLKLCDIFQVSLDELVKSDLTDRKPTPTAQIPVDAADTPTDITGYDAHWKSFAWSIAASSALVPLGLAIGFALAGTEAQLDRQPLFLIVPLFISIVACIYFGVLGATEHADFKREHPYVQDFYTADDRKRARSQFAREICIGTLLIFVGICGLVAADSNVEVGLFVISSGTNAATTSTFPIAIFMFCLALAIQRYVWASLLFARVNNIKSWDGEAAPQGEVTIGTHKLPVSTVTKIIMGVSTILAMLSLFVPELPFSRIMFWLYWVFGGIISSIVEAIYNKSPRE